MSDTPTITNSQDSPRQRAGDIMLWVGVNNRLPADKLPPGLVADAQNVRMRNGDIEPRLGVVKPGWLNQATGAEVLPAGSSLLGVGTFADPNTREWQITAADGLAWACCPNNYRHNIPLPTGVKLLSACFFVQAFNQLFCFRGRYLRPLVIRAWENGFEDVVPLYDATKTYNAAVISLEQDADEMAYGPYLATSSVTSAGNRVTVVTTTGHGYVTGADIVVKGANQAEYNGRFNITVVDATTFTYYFGGSATPTATGTIKVSNNDQVWKATGDRLTPAIGAVTVTSNVVSIASNAHGFVAGDLVRVEGATPAALNGTFVVQAGSTANIIQYNVTTADTTATGTIYVYRMKTTAGHTPDTNPEAWTRVWNVLPNADDAVFMNGRLLVPTAYTPGADDYDDTSSYTKKDYIVAMDIFDPVHFRFTNGFRINQGDDSEITNIVKYDANTAIVLKGKVWGVLNNLNADYSQITFDLRGGVYGCPALRAAIAAGKNIYFPSPGRGLTGLNQTENGILQSVDKAFSADIKKWVDRINWNLIDQQRLAWWNNCLYWAVSLGNAKQNNCVLVYDFETQQWVSCDTGAQLSVREFFKATLNGRERLLFAGNDGWANLMEEATAGDQTAGGWEEIPTLVQFRGDLFGMPGQKQFPLVELGLGVWNATFTVTLTSGGMRTVRTAVTDKTFSRTRYLKPFYAPPWDPLNAQQDWSRPNRGDYSVQLRDGMRLDGTGPLQFQEIFLRASAKTFRASYALITVTNRTGRLVVKHVVPTAAAGEQRYGLTL